MFYLWIDDLRTPPNDDNNWHWAKNVHEAKTHFIQLGGCNEQKGFLSLDHDAGQYAYIGGDYIEFLNWLERKQHDQSWNLSNIQFHIHSQNPVGVLRMRAIIHHNHWKEIR